MAIGIIVGIVLVVAAIGLFIGAYACYENDMNAGKVICLILALVCCLSFIVVPFSFHTVNSGELAVVKNLGKIVGTRDAGTNFDLWFTTSYHKYDTKVQNVEIATAAYSSDAQTMDVAMTLQYRVIPDKVTDIATQYGTLEVLQGRIQSIVIEKTKAVLSSHKAMDIIANRASISPDVEEAIKQAVGGEYFVSITAVVLTNIDFSDAFEKAVEDKMIAEQAKLKADYENETKIAKAEAEAKAKLKEAEAEIDIAKAKAEALKIEAQAKADANKLLTESLTDEVLESIFYEKWDGKLPTVMGNGSAILDLREPTAKEAE
jgi:regulator of protease activity HflC (stomatin/prohibitin superfamily)